MNEKEMEQQIIKTLSAISHEIQTPVNLIASSARISEMHLGKESHNIEMFKAYLENIVSNCNKISLLLNNVTEVNMINISRKEYVNSRQFFDTFCQSVEAYCLESNAKLQCKFGMKKEFIHFPVLTAERILLNLLSNALKYNDKDEKKVKIEMYDDEHNVIFSVKDNGIGISEENIAKVTKQFFRVDKSVPNGVGLGLTLVEKYLESLNGTMEIKSKLKKGTEIIISIPFTPENQIFDSNERDYIYTPEKSVFNIEFAQLKKHKSV